MTREHGGIPARPGDIALRVADSSDIRQTSCRPARDSRVARARHGSLDFHRGRLGARCRERGRRELRGRVPVAQESGRWRKAPPRSSDASDRGRDPFEPGPRFTPLALPAVNVGDETFRLGVVRQKPARVLEFGQGPIEIALDPIRAKSFGKLRLAQVGLQPKRFLRLGVRAPLQIFVRIPKAIEKRERGSEAGVGLRKARVEGDRLLEKPGRCS